HDPSRTATSVRPKVVQLFFDFFARSLCTEIGPEPLLTRHVGQLLGEELADFPRDEARELGIMVAIAKARAAAAVGDREVNVEPVLGPGHRDVEEPPLLVDSVLI